MEGRFSSGLGCSLSCQVGVRDRLLSRQTHTAISIDFNVFHPKQLQYLDRNCPKTPKGFSLVPVDESQCPKFEDLCYELYRNDTNY